MKKTIKCYMGVRGYGKTNYQLQQENHQLKDKIEKAIEIVESYNLGKYDYSVPPGGIIDLLEILKGEENE